MSEQIEPARLMTYAALAASIRKVQHRLDVLRRALDATPPPGRKRRRGRQPKSAAASSTPAAAPPPPAQPVRRPFRLGQSL
jgi:hypothetical protein